MLRVVAGLPLLRDSVAIKMAGRARATRASIAELAPRDGGGENLRVVFLSPPTGKLAPRTSKTFPMMEPMTEAFTTSATPTERAKIAMMSSAALPKVTLRMPPILGPESCPKDSVACPSTQGSPTRAREVGAKTRGTGARKISTPTTTSVGSAVAP